MTPLKVYFTGLELDPLDLAPRCIQGVIPFEWTRHRFKSEASTGQINRWLLNHIQGRWAVFHSYVAGERGVTIAFEHDYDASLFVLADGQTRCME